MVCTHGKIGKSPGLDLKSTVGTSDRAQKGAGVHIGKKVDGRSLEGLNHHRCSYLIALADKCHRRRQLGQPEGSTAIGIFIVYVRKGSER